VNFFLLKLADTDITSQMANVECNDTVFITTRELVTLYIIPVKVNNILALEIQFDSNAICYCNDCPIQVHEMPQTERQ